MRRKNAGSISSFGRRRMWLAQKKHWKSQRAVSSILTLFGTGGVAERYASVSSVMRSMRSVIPPIARPILGARPGTDLICIKPGLPGRSRAKHLGAVVAADARAHEERLARAVLLTQRSVRAVERDLAGREGEGRGVALVLRPAVGSGVVPSVRSARLDELGDHEARHEFHLARRKRAGERRHRGAGHALAQRCEHAALVEARGAREVARRRLDHAGSERARIPRVTVAEIAAEVVDLPAGFVIRDGRLGLRRAAGGERCARQQRGAPRTHQSALAGLGGWKYVRQRYSDRSAMLWRSRTVFQAGMSVPVLPSAIAAYNAGRLSGVAPRPRGLAPSSAERGPLPSPLAPWQAPQLRS